VITVQVHSLIPAALGQPPGRKAERNGVNRGLWFACALCIDGAFLAKVHRTRACS
jgi:hypothetical protein